MESEPANPPTAYAQAETRRVPFDTLPVRSYPHQTMSPATTLTALVSTTPMGCAFGAEFGFGTFQLRRVPTLSVRTDGDWV